MSYYPKSGVRGINPVIAIVIINVVVFVAVRLWPDLVYELGLWSRPVFAEQPWGLVTSIFTHYDMFHLFANMFTLYFFGSFILNTVGTKKFILLYLAGGLVGSAFFVLLAPFSIAIGASGAVFALGGALAVLAPQIRVYIFPIPAPLPVWVAVLGGFVILSFLPGIAWQAHLGGLLTGLVGGLMFKRSRPYIY